MRARWTRGTVVAALAAALALAAMPVVEMAARQRGFRPQRAVACRGQVDDGPVDASDEFHAGEGVVYIWFGGEETTRSTTVRAVCRRERDLIGIHEVTLPPGSDGGMVSIAPARSGPLATGRYSVDLYVAGTVTAQVRFRVIPDPDRPFPSRISGVLHEHLTDGFALVAPPHWQRLDGQDAPLWLLRDAPVAALVAVARTMDRAMTAGEVADSLCEHFAHSGDMRVTQRGTQELAGRDAASILVDMTDGTRQKIVLIGREPGRLNTAFYHVAVTTLRAQFFPVEAEFDAMLASFRVIPSAVP